MRCRYLHTDSGLALRNDRKRESNHVNASLQHFIRKNAGQFGITQHDWADGMIHASDGETCAGHGLSELLGVVTYLFDEFIRCHEQIEHFDG